MPNLIAIRLKALLLLTVFSANFCAVCRCQQMALARHTPSHSSASHKHSCCSEGSRSDETDKAPQKPCNERDGCCGAHAVKFGLLEKQTADPIQIHPLFTPALAPYFIVSLDIPLAGHCQGHIGYEWRHKHSPPDLQSLYQRFLI